MKKLAFLIGSILFTSTLIAQQDREMPAMDGGGKWAPGSNQIFGKLVGSNSQKPVEAASVQLFVVKSQGADSLIRGMLSRANGDFKLEDLPADSFKLVISAMGFEDKEVRMNSKMGMGGRPSFNKDLGNILLLPQIKKLSDVVVTSTRPTLELGVDRKVFNASKSTVATGGTAVELFKTIPSLSVDVDGNVQLRNSAPQIFVDGRPTILTLDQIPADNIDKVELITNPSAKFDAASSAGIINIILKKNKRIGLNGMFSAGVSIPAGVSSNANLNLRQGKLNFFVSGGYNQSGGESRSEASRYNKFNGSITDYFYQNTLNDRTRRFMNFRGGVDYFLDNRNTISFTQHMGRGRFKSNESQSQDFLDAQHTPLYDGDRLSNSQSNFRRNSSAINYTHKFPGEGRELKVDLNYNYGGNDGNATINNSFFYPDGSVYQPASQVENNSKGDNKQFTGTIDFSHPINNRQKIETGVRSYVNDVASKLDAYAIGTGQPQKLSLSNNYRYKEYIHAFYFTYSHKNKAENFSYQLGLRSEISKLDGLMVDSAFKFGYVYPRKLRNAWDAFFPSVFVTRKLGEEDELQANYSRRIRRPRFWQINPYVDINDPANVQMGNPALRPEFVDSYELNYTKNYSKGSLISTLYYRRSTDDITQYSDTITAAQYQNLKDAGINADAILNTFINAGLTRRLGAELVWQYKAVPNLELTPTLNLQYRKVNARVNNADLSNDGFNWEAQLTASYKLTRPKKGLWKDMSFQLNGDYESASVIPQGREKAEYSLDIAIKKEILKQKGSITFSVNDILNSSRWGTVYDTEHFYQDAYRRWSVRTFRLSFSYRFGKANFSLMRRGMDNGGGEQ